MFNNNTCRVCLADGAQYSIFDDIDCKESIYHKLYFCCKQKLDDINGYPRHICDSCVNNLNVAHDFITKFIEASKLLESEVVHVKNEHDENEKESEIMDCKDMSCKNDPDSDFSEQEPLDGYWVPIPIQKPKKKPSLTQVKAKLKNLKDINFKKKPKETHSRKSCKVKSILELKIGNEKSLRSGKLKQITEPMKQNYEKGTKYKQIPPEETRFSSTTSKKLCDTCGEICNDSHHLLKHRHVKHIRQPEKCPKCPQVLSSNDALKRHFKRKHGERPFICNICSGNFAFKKELAAHNKVVHLRIIRKPKKHLCDKCDRHFVTAKALLIHDRSVHTGLRPAECSECGSCFFHEDYLKEHMRLHTGEAPFKCPICDRGYAQRGNLRSHISHNHRLADLSEVTIKNLKPHWFKFLKKP